MQKMDSFHLETKAECSTQTDCHCSCFCQITPLVLVENSVFKRTEWTNRRSATITRKNCKNTSHRKVGDSCLSQTHWLSDLVSVEQLIQLHQTAALFLPHRVY